MVMVGGGIIEDGMSKSKVLLSGFCGLRVKVNLVLCVQFGSPWMMCQSENGDSMHAKNVKGIFERWWSRKKHVIKWKL